MNQAEREAAELVSESVNIQLQSDLGLRVELAKNEIAEIAEKTARTVQGIITKYNVPFLAEIGIIMKVNSVNLNREVQKLVDGHVKKLPVSDIEGLVMY